MKKSNFSIKIPFLLNETEQETEELLSKILDYYDYLNLTSEDFTINATELIKRIKQLREKYDELTTEYSKLRKAYGVLFFENSELFRRNSMIALKLNQIQQKVNKIKRKREEEKEIEIEKTDLNKIEKTIMNFYKRYLAKKDE